MVLTKCFLSGHLIVRRLLKFGQTHITANAAAIQEVETKTGQQPKPHNNLIKDQVTFKK